MEPSQQECTVSFESYRVRAIRTELYRSGQDLGDFLVQNLQSLKPRDGWIVAVTSKIVSVAEGRLVPRESISKADLVRRESDVYLGEIAYDCHLTIKHGLLIPSAGIDESNSERGSYILYPKAPFASAQRLHSRLCLHFSLTRLGIIITDSHTTPLRRGVTGISLAYWGIRGIASLVGHPDLFGKPLRVTNVNVVDALAGAAVFAMGEANDQRPLAVIKGVEAEFTDDMDQREVAIPIEEDLYVPILARRQVPDCPTTRDSRSQ